MTRVFRGVTRWPQALWGVRRPFARHRARASAIGSAALWVCGGGGLPHSTPRSCSVSSSASRLSDPLGPACCLRRGGHRGRRFSLSLSLSNSLSLSVSVLLAQSPTAAAGFTLSLADLSGLSIRGCCAWGRSQEARARRRSAPPHVAGVSKADTLACCRETRGATQGAWANLRKI